MTAFRPSLRLLAAALAVVAALAGAEAAAPVFWRVSTQAEFLAGEVENLSVDPAGRLLLGPRSDLVHEAADPFAWSLASSGGALWIGTGGSGRVVRVAPDGGAATVFEAAASAVQALAGGAEGRVYAATSPNGRVVSLAPDGSASDVFTPSEPYVWALAVAADGALLVGTGNPGRIYRVAPGGDASLLYDTRATHVLSLAVDRQGNVLAGTGSPGRVLRIDPQGKPFVLLAPDSDEVTALRVAPDGAVYAPAAAGNRPAAPPAPAATAPAAGREPVPTVSVTTEVTAVVTTAGPTPVAAADAAPVDPHVVGGGIRLRAGGRHHRAVDGDPALAHERLGRPARGDPGRGNQLLQPHAVRRSRGGHGCPQWTRPDVGASGSPEDSTGSSNGSGGASGPPAASADGTSMPSASAISSTLGRSSRSLRPNWFRNSWVVA